MSDKELQLLKTLDSPCVYCNNGENGEGQPCVLCKGWGWLLNEEGEILIRFLERHGFSRSISPQAEHELQGIIEYD